MNLWEQAEQMHERAGLPYLEQLNYYMHSAYLLKGPDWMIWGEPIDDTWFIYLAIGKNCIPAFINCMPFWLPKYGYARFLRKDHRLRTRPLEPLVKHYGYNLEHLKSRKA